MIKYRAHVLLLNSYLFSKDSLNKKLLNIYLIEVHERMELWELWARGNKTLSLIGYQGPAGKLR